MKSLQETEHHGTLKKARICKEIDKKQNKKLTENNDRLIKL